MNGRLLTALNGPHAWMLLAQLMSRASGFLTGLVLARTAGPGAVGLYTTVMNTASSVVAPLAQPLANNATLMAGERGAPGLGALWRAHSMVTIAAVILGLPAFAWLFGRAVDPADSILTHWSLVHLAALAVVISQLGTPLVAALLHGEGRFRPTARRSALAGLLMLIAVLPVVTTWGLDGALVLAAASALLGWSLLTVDLLRRHSPFSADGDLAQLRHIAQRLRTALPSMAATGLGAAVNWLCTIYMIHSLWGAEGVGLLGIGLQWSTLMLAPVTSWGGLTLQLLGEAHRRGERAALASLLRARIRRNAGVTSLISLAVVLGAGWLERAYGLRDSELPLVLCGFAAAAVVASINNVFERFWWAAGRQRAWFAWNSVGLALQLGATAWLLPHHLAFASVGVLVASLAVAGLSAASLPKYLAELQSDRT